MNLIYFVSAGSSQRFSISEGAGKLTLVSLSDCEIDVVRNNAWSPLTVGETVESPTGFEGLTRASLTGGSDGAATLRFEPDGGGSGIEITVSLLVIGLEVFVDADRDGTVDTDSNGNGNWTWGPGGRGAVLMVNNDRDLNDFDPGGNSRSELSSMVVELRAPQTGDRFAGILRTTSRAAARFSVYRVTQQGPEVVLGKLPDGSVLTEFLSLEMTRNELFVEGHEFPGPFFEGLVTIEVVLATERGGRFVELLSDRAVFRAAPWIMTPNTLEPLRVFTCDMTQSEAQNPKFLDELKTATAEAGVPLHIIPSQQNLGDRWIQDEIEFGYSVSPTHALPVVYDSPRDRGLDGFPEAALLGPDFGHFQIGGSAPNSLDSFGNLEVSPPVTVNGRFYPFGRVVFGGRQQGDFQDGSRQMMPEIRRFLYAQKVQRPIEIFTDWLAVGHVDEIVCFVPANNDLGFQMLMASPNRALAILRRVHAEGHGNATLFTGKSRSDGSSAEITVDKILEDTEFSEANEIFQSYQDQNREILKDELAIREPDILEIPVLFYPPANARTLAYFPDMVNHLVLREFSLVPRPYGPKVGGIDQFEQAFRDAMPDREVRFIEDWDSYHELSGEVHCGTNCLRKPPLAKWWETLPEGGFDV